ncbi:MAG: hypothetical protein M1378_09000 [Bacteroidetes bacterium]|jgi:ABC-type uncharacterized transport system substrate-binding protein|nr:hypothetical protein [Bacteroidota bacterium]MCL5035316.1 hypothetical protein [Bacteroidota bacterium]
MLLFKKVSVSTVVTIVAFMAMLGTPRAAGTSATPLQSIYMMKQIVPKVTTVGIMWNKSTINVSDLLPQINRASLSVGVKVVIEDVEQIQDVSAKFRDLVENYHIQVLWILQNDDLYGSSIVKGYLIKNSTLSGVALFAPGSDWVSAGACAALMSEGGNAKLFVNQKTLTALGLTVPQQFAQTTQFLATN